MATRSLTEVFILMRNNAIQHRQFFSRHSDEAVTDRTALVAREERETDVSFGKHSSFAPPEWADTVEEVQYNVSKIQQRLKVSLRSHVSPCN